MEVFESIAPGYRFEAEEARATDSNVCKISLVEYHTPASHFWGYPARTTAIVDTANIQKGSDFGDSKTSMPSFIDGNLVLYKPDTISEREALCGMPLQGSFYMRVFDLLKASYGVAYISSFALSKSEYTASSVKKALLAAAASNTKDAKLLRDMWHAAGVQRLLAFPSHRVIVLDARSVDNENWATEVGELSEGIRKLGLKDTGAAAKVAAPTPNIIKKVGTVFSIAAATAGLIKSSEMFGSQISSFADFIKARWGSYSAVIGVYDGSELDILFRCTRQNAVDEIMTNADIDTITLSHELLLSVFKHKDIFPNYEVTADYTWRGALDAGKIQFSRGYIMWAILLYRKLRTRILEALPRVRLINVVGHSLGAGISECFAALIMLDRGMYSKFNGLFELRLNLLKIGPALVATESYAHFIADVLRDRPETLSSYTFCDSTDWAAYLTTNVARRRPVGITIGWNKPITVIQKENHESSHSLSVYRRVLKVIRRVVKIALARTVSPNLAGCFSFGYPLLASVRNEGSQSIVAWMRPLPRFGTPAVEIDIHMTEEFINWSGLSERLDLANVAARKRHLFSCPPCKLRPQVMQAVYLSLVTRHVQSILDAAKHMYDTIVTLQDIRVRRVYVNPNLIEFGTQEVIKNPGIFISTWLGLPVYASEEGKYILGKDLNSIPVFTSAKIVYTSPRGGFRLFGY